MPDSLERTKAHYAPLFSRFTADVGAGAPQFERDCLAFELSQVAGLPQSGLVLDAGCGSGRYSAAWHALFPAATVIGIDINDVVLRHGLVDPQALAPVHGNLESLPFRTGAFDVVMSRGVIQHTADPRQALSELVRICKPGGILFFYTYRHGWYDVALGQLRKVAAWLGVRPCSRAIYAVSRAARFDPRVPAMILDELFVPIRFAFSEETIREWLHACGVADGSIRPVQHAQFANLALPVNRQTRWLRRIIPTNGLIALAVHLGAPAPAVGEAEGRADPALTPRPA